MEEENDPSEEAERAAALAQFVSSPSGWQHRSVLLSFGIPAGATPPYHATLVLNGQRDTSDVAKRAGGSQSGQCLARARSLTTSIPSRCYTPPQLDGYTYWR